MQFHQLLRQVSVQDNPYTVPATIKVNTAETLHKHSAAVTPLIARATMPAGETVRIVPDPQAGDRMRPSPFPYLVKKTAIMRGRHVEGDSVPSVC